MSILLIGNEFLPYFYHAEDVKNKAQNTKSNGNDEEKKLS